MDLQTVSNIVLSALSVVLVIVSVVIAIGTLRQNNRMIESSTRPYVGFKIERINTGTDRCLFVLRNYGSSAAVIRRFDLGIDLSQIKSLPTEIGPFEGVENTTLLPGQQLATVFDYKKLRELAIDLRVSITYESLEKKTYIEKYPINIYMNSGMVYSRTSTGGNELKSISYSLQEIVERLL